LTIANIESSLNPDSQNNIYKGLFALNPLSDYNKKTLKLNDKWNNPILNAYAGIKLIKYNIIIFIKKLGDMEKYINLSDWAKNLQL